MFNKSKIWGSLAGLGLLLGTVSGAAEAQMPVEMPAAGEQTAQFRRLDQPLGVKVAVTVGGLALIGLELWWFLLSKTQAQEAKPVKGYKK